MKITVTFADGSVKTYDDVEAWRDDTKIRGTALPADRRPGKKAAVEVAKSYSADLRAGRKTAVNPDSEPHVVSEGAAISRKFDKLREKPAKKGKGKKRAAK
jgi:hypothetical protein